MIKFNKTIVKMMCIYDVPNIVTLYVLDLRILLVFLFDLPGIILTQFTIEWHQ